MNTSLFNPTRDKYYAMIRLRMNAREDTLAPGARKEINEMVMTWLPYFTFIMYAVNRGTGFTKALFMNCDHSLLTYSFYKQPRFILKLFRIRLREIMKINAL